MGTAAGGRLTFRLMALAVLMASGAAGVAMVGPGRGPAAAGSGRNTRMLGSALSQTGAAPDTAPGATPGSGPSASGPAPGGLARDAAGRFNVDAPHSPELLHLLAAAKSGQPGNAGQPAKAGTAPSTTVPSTPGPGVTAPSTAGRAGTGPGTAAPGGTGAGGSKSAGTGPGAGAPATARPDEAPITEGVDVAAAQHPRGALIDWTKVAAAGYTFAAIKSTEGDYYTNPYGAADLAGAKAAGLYVTGYHFAIPNVSGGAAQADFAVSHGAYAAGGRTSRVGLDVEYDPYTGTDHTNACYGLSPAQMVSWISAFGAEAQRLTGQRPLIYTTAAWWATCTGDSITSGADPLWVAAPALAGPAGPARPARPAPPAGWSGWAFWQFSSGATVPGIHSAGHTDVSEANGSRLALLEHGPRPGATGAAAPAPSAGTSGGAVAPTGS